MKKIIVMVLAIMMVLSCMVALTSCDQDPMAKAQKQAQKVIDQRNTDHAGEETFEAELVYNEADDSYDYIIKVMIIKEGNNVDANSIAHGLYQNIWGYFDEFENVEFVVEVYYLGNFYHKYVNDQVVE